MGFLLHRTVYINIHLRAGWRRLWQEARFEVHREKMKELLMTILRRSDPDHAQIFHSSILSVYMETCELSSPIHPLCGGVMVAEEDPEPHEEKKTLQLS